MRVDREKRESDFNKTIEEFKDPKTEHIMLSPEQAKDIIFKFFIYDTLGNLGRTMPEDWPDSKLVVLAQNAEAGKNFDFTEALEKFKEEETRKYEAEQERKFGKRGINIISPTL